MTSERRTLWINILDPSVGNENKNQNSYKNAARLFFQTGTSSDIVPEHQCNRAAADSSAGESHR